MREIPESFAVDPRSLTLAATPKKGRKLSDLAYYQSAREAAHCNRPGAKAVYTDLRQRFPGTGRTASSTPVAA